MIVTDMLLMLLSADGLIHARRQTGTCVHACNEQSCVLRTAYKNILATAHLSFMAVAEPLQSLIRLKPMS